MVLDLNPEILSGPDSDRLRPGLLARGMNMLAVILQQEWRAFPLWLPVGMGAGIVGYFARSTEPARAVLLLPPLVALLLLALRRHPAWAWPAALGLMITTGYAVAAWHASGLPAPLMLPGKAVIVTGSVETVQTLPQGLRVTLSGVMLDEGPGTLPRDIRLRLRKDDPLHPSPGDRLRVRALLRAPSAPAYPGAWDFQRDAYFSGLGGSGFAIGSAERLQEADRAPVFATLRASMEQRVAIALPGSVGAIAAALITGGQSAIAPDAMAAMRDSGLAHLLSVSGLHIAIVMGLGFGVARCAIAFWPWLALRHDGRLLAAPAALLLGLGYLALTGFQVPMQRSFASAALMTLAVLLGRRVFSMRALALGAVAVMLIQPAAVLGPSFQMSFAAVMALVAGAEATAGWMTRWRRSAEWWRRPLLILMGSVLTSVLATLATLPFGLFHFGRIQLYGVVANMLAVPVTSFLIMPAALAAAALMPLHLESWPLAVMGWGVEVVLWVARTVASWPGAALLARPMPAWALAMTSFGMIWLCLWRSRWRCLGLPLIATGLCASFWTAPPDVLVSADARLIAFRTDGAVVLHRASGASNFIRDSWLRGWGEDEAEPYSDKTAGDDALLPCAGLICRFQPREGSRAALLLKPARTRRGETAPPVTAAPACGQEAAVLISPEPIRGRCEGIPVVDRFSVWRNGSHAIWLEPGGARILSDREWRGDRPWVPRPPRPAWERRQENKPLGVSSAEADR